MKRKPFSFNWTLTSRKSFIGLEIVEESGKLNSRKTTITDESGTKTRFWFDGDGKAVKTETELAKALLARDPTLVRKFDFSLSVAADEIPTLRAIEKGMGIK